MMYDSLLEKCTLGTCHCHLTVFEELKEDITKEMLKVLEFLDLEITEKVLNCISTDNMGKFKNKKRNDEDLAAIKKLLSNKIFKKDLDALYNDYKKSSKKLY